jgi:hypothetical protein
MARKPTVTAANPNAALLSAKRLARSLDNIRAVDYGYAYKKGTLTQRPAIRFHMDRKRSLSALSKDQRLPDFIEGVEVDVLSVGYAPHNGSPRSQQQTMQPGLSVGSVKQKTTGTLGAIVRDLTSQQLCILSNWHVLCGGPEAAANDEISQPGPMDLGMNPVREIGRLDRWLRLAEQYDAALARITPQLQSTNELFGTTLLPKTTAQPVLGMRIVKSGAVSGVTYGVIDGINGSYRLDYTEFGDAFEWMEGFRIVPDTQSPAKSISLAGDSGSLWVDATGQQAVGLHFAGEDDASPLNDYALAHSIDDVLGRLNIALAAS